MTDQRFWELSRIADERIAETEHIRSSDLYSAQEKMFAELLVMWAGTDVLRAGQLQKLEAEKAKTS